MKKTTKEILFERMNKVAGMPINEHTMTSADIEQAADNYDEPIESPSYQVKLDMIGSLAQELHNELGHFEELPSWIQDKITIAEHNLVAISDWVETQGHKEDLDEDKKMKGDDPCWDGYEMVGHKEKNGKEVPNCVPKD